MSTDPSAIRAEAVTLLSRREYCSAELLAKLIDRGFNPDAVRAGIEELSAERLVDDERYVEHYLRRHAERGQGPYRIRQELAALGLPASLIDAGLQTGPDFHALARQVRSRKFGAEPPAAWKERARQARFLQYRGFAGDHIKAAMGADALDLADDPL